VAYLGGLVFAVTAVVVIWAGFKKMRAVNRTDDLD